MVGPSAMRALEHAGRTRNSGQVGIRSPEGVGRRSAPRQTRSCGGDTSPRSLARRVRASRRRASQVARTSGDGSPHDNSPPHHHLAHRRCTRGLALLTLLLLGFSPRHIPGPSPQDTDATWQRASSAPSRASMPSERSALSACKGTLQDSALMLLRVDDGRRQGQDAYRRHA